MLTIFSCPKPFHGHINIIQRNALKSWTLLNPRPEIILIGDEEGIADVCKEFGIRHIPEVERNEYGTPLLNAIFEEAEKAATNQLMCYVNTDIIFLNDFIQTVEKFKQNTQNNGFLIAGRRWNVDIENSLDFDVPDWDQKLKDYVFLNGIMDNHAAIDYFIFRKGLLSNIPPFALGRGHWDHWLLYKVRTSGLPLIDASFGITVIHQNHDYSHASLMTGKKGIPAVLTGPEVKKNIELCKSNSFFYTLWDSTHFITESGLRKAGLKRILRRYALRWRMYIAYFVIEVLYPYSYPLILIIEGIKSIVANLMKWIRPRYKGRSRL